MSLATRIVQSDAGPTIRLPAGLGTPSLLIVLALVVVAHGISQDEASVDALVNTHLDAAKKAEASEDYLAASREYEAILKLRPGWALIHQSLGVTLHLAGRFDRAIDSLREATRLDGQLWGAFLFLGMDYYQTHQFELAIRALKQSAELNSGMLETHRWLGLSLAAVGRFREAIGQLQRVAEESPTDEEALFSLARAYDNRAAQLFTSIGLSDPNSPFVFLLQAERYASEGESDRARVEYRRALALRPDLAGTLGSVHRDPLASNRDIDAGGGRFAEVRGLFEDGRFVDAADRAKSALASEPESAEAMYWLGRAYKGLAAATLQRLIDAAPLSHRVDQLEAEAHMGRTEFAKAVEAYSRAIEKKPQLPGLRYALGQAYSRMGRFQEATKSFEDELARNPHHALARHRLGSLLLDRGRAAEALRHLLRSVEARPASAEARFDLGRAYLENRDYAEAAREFEDYAESHPESDRVHFLLANAYRGLGRMEDARRELELYQDLSRKRLQRVQEDVRSVSEDVNRRPK